MKTGSVSVNRPSVTSTTVRPGSATRAMRSWRSCSGPGCDHASQAESGDQVSPVTSPLRDDASSVTSPDEASTTNSLPSRAATAMALPSGAAARSSAQPMAPAASRRAGAAGAVPAIAAISIASAPSASVTQATRPVLPSTRGSRARTPGTTDSARAGPSRCVSQCTVPRTSTTLACPE